MIEGFEPLSVADASETVGGGWIGIIARVAKELFFSSTELADGTLPDAGPGSGGSGGSTRSGDYGCGGDTNEDPGCGEVGDLGF